TLSTAAHVGRSLAFHTIAVSPRCQPVPPLRAKQGRAALRSARPFAVDDCRKHSSVAVTARAGFTRVTRASSTFLPCLAARSAARRRIVINLNAKEAHMPTENNTRRPDFRLFAIIPRGEGKKAFWQSIGVG